MRRKLITDKIKATTISSVHINKVVCLENEIFPVTIRGEMVFGQRKANFTVKRNSKRWFLGPSTDWEEWPVGEIDACAVMRACLEESADLRKRIITREI